MKTRNKEKIKKIASLLFILLTLGGVIFFAIRSGDFAQISKALFSMDPLWLAGALGCFLIHLLFEGGITFLFFRFQKIRVRLNDSITVGLVGMYYSSITPAASGGQPLQVYALRKRGIPAGIATSALMVKFFCWQCAIILIGIVLWATHIPLIDSALYGNRWIVVMGLIINFAAVAAIFMLAINRNIVRGLIIFFVKLGHRLRLVKDEAKTSSKMDATLDDFHGSVNLLTRNPGQFIVMFLLSMIQVLGLMSAIYFIYRGLGLKSAGYIELLTMQVMLYIPASFTPFPGGSGAFEFGFHTIFSRYFPNAQLFAAMFLWRFITYYLSIITGFIAVMIDSLTHKTKSAPPSEGTEGKELVQNENS